MALVTPRASAAIRRRVESELVSRDRNAFGLVLQILLLVATLFTMLVLFVLLAKIITEAWPVLTQRKLAFITNTIGSEPTKVGVWPGLYGSFIIGLGVVVVSVPIGLAAAIYLEEYASPTRLTRLITVNIRNLAGVPAVIYGVLGLTIFVGWLKPLTQGKTVIAASLTLAVLVLPVVIITASEALRAVPRGLREAGYGVGATKWEVTRDHTLPYAMPGMLTGAMLSLSRALGEAAPLILVGAITGLLPRTSLDGKFTALPILIFSWSGRPAKGTEIDWPNVAAAAGLVLLLMVLFFNAIAIVLRTRFERRRVGQ
jgi:phosphate transport system permease protein